MNIKGMMFVVLMGAGLSFTSQAQPEKVSPQGSWCLVSTHYQGNQGIQNQQWNFKPDGQLSMVFNKRPYEGRFEWQGKYLKAGPYYFSDVKINGYNMQAQLAGIKTYFEKGLCETSQISMLD